jgi:predicted kinase
VYVAVTGPPASGKSTLARSLADELGLPLLAKDSVKDGLMALRVPANVAESRALGREAVQRLLVEAAAAGEGVLDSVWVDRGGAVDRLSALGEVVEVFCRTDLDTMRRRYGERAPTKGRSHFDEKRAEDELWPREALRPLAGPWPVLEVDTAGEVDVRAVARRVRAAGTALDGQ